MARHLFFAITLIGIGVLLNSPAEAVPDAARCEDQAANCLGRCVNPSGGTGQNKCLSYCEMRCSTLKVRSPEAKTLIDKIKADLKKRAELKAQRMLLKEPKKKPKR